MDVYRAGASGLEGDGDPEAAEDVHMAQTALLEAGNGIENTVEGTTHGKEPLHGDNKE